MSAEIRSAKAKLAVATRHHPDSDHTALKRNLKAANLEAYVRGVIASWPPLLPEQLDRIAVLLRPGGGV